MTDDKKDFWGWWKDKNKDVTFTVDEVKELCEEVKEFNAGCIDEYLSNHVDKVVQKWLDTKSE